MLNTQQDLQTRLDELRSLLDEEHSLESRVMLAIMIERMLSDPKIPVVISQTLAFATYGLLICMKPDLPNPESN